MTSAVALFLDRLRVYLLEKGTGERRKLIKFYRQRMGKRILPNKLSMWLNLHTCPSFDSGLVLLSYAKSRGLIAAGNPGEGLFVYPVKKPLPAKQRAKIVKRHFARYAAAGKKAA